MNVNPKSIWYGDHVRYSDLSQLEHQISQELRTVALVKFFFSLISLFSRRRERSEGVRVIVGENSDIVENYILTMQRFLAVSRFLYSGGW